MHVMAKSKTAGTDKAKPQRTKPLGVQFYTDQATVDALNSYLASLPEHKRPKKRAVIEAGLHMLLEQEGFWPPKAKG